MAIDLHAAFESEPPTLDFIWPGFLAGTVGALVAPGASVLYLHHVSKGSAREGGTDQQQAARGASALIDNARWCGFIAKMTEKEAKSLSDQEFSRQPIGSDRRGFFCPFWC